MRHSCQEFQSKCDLLDDSANRINIISNQSNKLKVSIFRNKCANGPCVIRSDKLVSESSNNAREWFSARVNSIWVTVFNSFFIFPIDFHLEKFSRFLFCQEFYNRLLNIIRIAQSADFWNWFKSNSNAGKVVYKCNWILRQWGRFDHFISQDSFSFIQQTRSDWPRY